MNQRAAAARLRTRKPPKSVSFAEPPDLASAFGVDMDARKTRTPPERREGGEETKRYAEGVAHWGTGKCRVGSASVVVEHIERVKKAGEGVLLVVHPRFAVSEPAPSARPGRG
jgi:alkanesulfonate monooxygenase SsuD/methylene tetrahydromethanopterin reductase-like flavin-dependent oxidoreductase (luciferase family)